ncbi:MAG: DUF2298 domain-containing protein [Anaerolineales bacterium]
MIPFAAWYLFISFLGFVTFPIVYRIFPALPDKGYPFSRAAGLMLWGYIFWLLASLGIVHNDSTGLLFALGLILVFAAWFFMRSRNNEVLTWMRTNFRTLAGIELLFLLTFAAWTIVRAANPAAVGTEKPMELAFINAISRSSTFPPNDPWLSGYSISYYHFGYILIAMLAGITGVQGSIAFNLGTALIFGLSAVGSFSIVNNLVIISKRQKGQADRKGVRFTISALLGPLFLLIVSNLEGFLHSIHNRGILWFSDSAGGLFSPFWKWLDIKDLNQPPPENLSFIPDKFWWWWRASRVIQDFDLAGAPKEIINEFPFFSYLLADMHPHLLVMPFILIAMGFALNLILGGGWGEIRWTQFKLDLRSVVWSSTIAAIAGIGLIQNGLVSLSTLKTFGGLGLLFLSGYVFYSLRHDISVKAWLSHGIKSIEFGLPLHINIQAVITAALLLGGIAFLNTWDAPIYAFLIPGGYALSRVLEDRIPARKALKEFFWLIIICGAGAFIFYLPFYIGFSSQAGGVIPNLIYPTRGAHLWVMFAPLLLPLFALLIYLLFSWEKQAGTNSILKRGLFISAGAVLILFLLSIAIGVIASNLPGVTELFLGSIAAPDVFVAVQSAFIRRILNPGGWVTLTLLLFLSLSLLLKIISSHTWKTTLRNDPQLLNSQRINALAYTALIIFLGVVLVLGPEFFFLRDQFGWRINTIFKFYFQSWILWSIAGAYGTIFLFGGLKQPYSLFFKIAFILVLGMSMVYPIFSLWSVSAGFSPERWTLDSTSYLENSNPDEMAAINWLKTAPFGVVAEAVSYSGGSYTGYARIATHTGLPSVLGWIGHENQWRGGNIEIGSRQGDIERLYCSQEWTEIKPILDVYNIRYVVIGSLERSTYQPNQSSCPTGLEETKFHQFLVPVFQSGGVTIFENPRE